MGGRQARGTSICQRNQEQICWLPMGQPYLQCHKHRIQMGSVSALQCRVGAVCMCWLCTGAGMTYEAGELHQTCLGAQKLLQNR